MKQDDAAALELFIKDHDTRFVPSAGGEGAEAFVLLKRPEDGEELKVHSVEEYGREYMEKVQPGETIRTAWQKWLEQRGGK